MNKPKITYAEFVQKFNSEILPNKPADIRTGQCLMNFLAEVHPAEDMRLSSVNYYDRTDIDCFYNDELVPNTLKHLEEVWDK
jgi:hypothetical protein